MFILLVSNNRFYISVIKYTLIYNIINYKNNIIYYNQVVCYLYQFHYSVDNAALWDQETIIFEI